MSTTTIPWNILSDEEYEITDEDFPTLPKTTKCSTLAGFHMLKNRARPDVPNAWFQPIQRVDRFPRWNELTYEIRQQIIRYQLYISDEIPREVDIVSWLEDCGPNPSTKQPHFLPLICFASKQMFAEATAVFIEEVEWKIRSAAANNFLRNFLEGLTTEVNGKKDEVGFKSLRNIYLSSFEHFATFHRFPGIETIGQHMEPPLIKRFTGLKHLTLTFHASFMENRAEPMDEETGFFPLKDVEKIVKFYGIEDIFKCRNLETFTVDGITSENYSSYADDRMADVANWVRVGFLRQWNQVVEVDVVWRTYTDLPYREYWVYR